VELLTRVTKAVESKIHHGGARDILIWTLAYEGATTESKAAINAVKNGSIEKWTLATHNIGTHSHQMAALANAFSEIMMEPKKG
jgi:hypothetical protein